MNSGPSTFGENLLPVGKIIKPDVSEASVREIIKRLYGMVVKNIKELNSYTDRMYLIQVKEEHTNSYIDSPRPEGYVLKVVNSSGSKKHGYVEAIQSLIIHAHDQGFETSRPIQSVSGKLMHLEAIPFPNAKTGDLGVNKKEHIVCLFTYIPGDLLSQVPYTAQLCYRVGKYGGRLVTSFKTFHHSFYDTHGSFYSLQNLPKLQDFIYAVENVSDREIVNQVLERFKAEVIPSLRELQAGMIHNDLNDQNLIVRHECNTHTEDYEVCGVIDFWEANQSYYLFEIAISMCYMITGNTVIDPLDAAGHALAGYVSEIALTERELSFLKVCVAGRLCQSLVMAAYYALDPSSGYVHTTGARGWPRLRNLWSTPSDQLNEQWRRIISTYNK